MFVLSTFLTSLASVIDVALTLYTWIVIISALISWVNPDPYNPIVRFLYQVTEPALNFLRRFIPLQFGGIDLSPLLLILLLQFLRNFLVHTLYQLAMRMA